MAGTRLAALVRRLRRDVTPDLGACSDADLLARFAATRDNAAFELLVWRHGAMVLSACRRVLGHQQDAEDAFQAAFLVLARKAATVRSGVTVPAWLHRVAVRIAQRAAGKRRTTVALVAEPPARPAPDAVEQNELRGLLDAEIDRLREPYRRAFVLCYLEGLSNADAARVLGCPVGTIESRLSAARRELRHRLSRQRVALPVGILALLVTNSVLGSDAVATATRAGVLAADSGLRAAIGIVGEPAVKLAERGLTMTKTRTWVVAVLGVALIGLVTGVGWANRPIDSPVEPEVAVAPESAEPAVAPPPTPVGENAAKTEAWPLAKQIQWQGGNLFGVAPDGKSIFLLYNSNQIYGISLVGKAGTSIATSENKILAAAVSPDGKYLATAEGANGVKLRDATTGRVIEALWPEGELPAVQVTFVPDGTKLIALCTRTPSGGFAGRPSGPGSIEQEREFQQLARVSVWDVATRKELGHPAQTDKAKLGGLPFYTLAGHGRFMLKSQPVYGANAEGEQVIKSRRITITDAVSGVASKPIEVVGATLAPMRSEPLSPDGKTLVLSDYTQHELRFLDAETGKDRFRVPAFRRPIKTVAFSPDGKLVAAATGISGGARRDDTIAAPSEVVIWDTATGRERARLTDKETIRDYFAIAFSPDGSFLVAQAEGSSKQITIWGHPPTPEPEPAKPVAKAAGGAEAPARFQGLFRDLAGEGVTDSRRIETLFLAALGRFPTDVEARTLVSQLARRDDKAAALRDLLGTLVETTEFKKHAEELGRLAK
ncbi:sigma-70 family rna polymerase sigma factor : Uncultured bacterium genome assembly Metasoil_fosmids_resub OS=uncultured bacterium PE=4 SV=1: Sigma70_r2: Sigma70_r4_2 [Gemmata massiliana]|uniref:ECF RNA polymerase sigma factor SigE n=1 Tax=Gemmata massiliana TaxID=1210884 RepID=A0A6P2D780_9BACT|nr:sigma-70 family RNA polymerase sigma factor [Gemmata massiliana]VTR96787.1 sigma-70 family rna polymerase sigma factor : Uncultured bacterium genome assembly Metasoil_fosmids_resub OS=uncultured bacterium PE=4 SV=1: Sigma70_r2: Sigma70_r4_2 [Gemmata massiliana]